MIITATAAQGERKPVTLHRLHRMLAEGEKIVMLTAYDASFARLADEAGVDCLLVGDSLGLVVQRRTSTVPVTLDEVAYHLRCVAAGNRHAWLLGDLPFGTYEASPSRRCARAPCCCRPAPRWSSSKAVGRSRPCASWPRVGSRSVRTWA